MISLPSVGDQPFQISAQSIIPESLRAQIQQEFEAQSLFQHESNLGDPDSSIMPSKSSQVVQQPFSFYNIDLSQLTPDLGEPKKSAAHPLVQHRYHNADDEDLFEEINEAVTPVKILDFEDKIQEKIDTPFDGKIGAIEKDVEHNVDDIIEDIYPEAREDLKKAKWYTYVYYFRWMINFIFIGSPYFMMSCGMVLVNIIMNIMLNNWWAGGNYLLVFNTCYLILQTIMSWPLIFEIPFYLSSMRFFRMFSVFAAWVYSMVYGFVILDWVYQLYLEPEKAYEDYQFLDILINMFLGYNVIFHLHLVPVNAAIITKEIFLEIFPPMLKQNQGENLDLQDVGDAVDPTTYVELVKHGTIPDSERHANQYKSKVTRFTNTQKYKNKFQRKH